MTLKSLFDKCRKFVKNEEGASGIEYAIIAAMVALVLVGFMGDDGISGQVDNIFNSIKDALTTSTETTSG